LVGDEDTEGVSAGGRTTSCEERLDRTQDFDAVLRELQQVVQQLESGNLDLEQSLEIFERGIGLSRRGQEILDSAEHKVEMLLNDGRTKEIDPNGSSLTGRGR